MTGPSTLPPYRIETERLVTRCKTIDDAQLLDDAIKSSADHLRRWLEWAHQEPQTIEQRKARLESVQQAFDSGEDFEYGIFTSDESTLIGGTGLHTRRGPDTLEIGYWLRHDYVKRGLATESVAGLVRVAFELVRVSRVEIRCDPMNKPSSAIPRRLGFTRERTLRGSDEFLGEPRDTEIWALLTDQYPTSPSYGVRLKAFDRVGVPVLE